MVQAKVPTTRVVATIEWIKKKNKKKKKKKKN